MAPVAMILGGISGTISALFGWLLFGVGFWGAVQLYFCVALGVAGLLIVMSLLRGRSAARPRATGDDGRAKPASLQRA